VLGYDLLNEPIPHFPKLTSLNSSLEPLTNEHAAIFIRRSRFPMSAIVSASLAPTSPTVTTVGMKFIPLHASKFSAKPEALSLAFESHQLAPGLLERGLGGGHSPG